MFVVLNTDLVRPGVHGRSRAWIHGCRNGDEKVRPNQRRVLFPGLSGCYNGWHFDEREPLAKKRESKDDQRVRGKGDAGYDIFQINSPGGGLYVSDPSHLGLVLFGPLFVQALSLLFPFDTFNGALADFNAT